jgi:hypothetical protein
MFLAATDETIPVAERTDELQESCESSVRCHRSISSCPQLYQAAVHALRALGQNPESRPGKSSAITAAEVLFPNEWQAIVQIINDGKAGKMSTSTENRAGPVDRASHGDSSSSVFQISRALGQRWAVQEKYSGSTDGISFTHFKRDYLTAMKELGVSRTDYVNYQHHALKDNAKEHFHERIQGSTVTQLSDAFQNIEEKFLDDASQIAIRAELISMRLSAIQERDDLDKIHHLSGYGSKEYRSETGMLDVLEKHEYRENHGASRFVLRSREKYTLDSFANTLCAYLQSLKEKGDMTVFLGKPSERIRKSDGSVAMIGYGESYNSD